MTMKSENKYLATVDFFMVEPQHESIHARLENWARYVGVKRPSWVHPMWKQGKSNGRQWHVPELAPQVDTLDGHRVEKIVAALPEPFRGVIRWAYVFKYGALNARRQFALSEAGLWEALSRGRTMVKNTL